jgi:L-fuculose-phosphate aldolase
MGNNNILRKLSKEVERFSHLCYDRFLVRAAGGNISVRLPDNRGFLITPTGTSLRDIRAEELVLIDMEGNKIGGHNSYKPSKEVNLHLAIYTLCPDATAVVHVHPPYATAFSILEKPFPLLTSQARFKLINVPIADYADPGTMDLVNNIKKEINKPGFSGRAILLRNHGLISWDTSLALAFDTAELVEETAMITFVSTRLHIS